MSEIKNRVNTYLYAAQILAEQSEVSENAAQCRVSIIGASLSLKQAWETWLEELASYLKIPVSEIGDESSENASQLPDCQFLFSMKRETGSWYQQLSALLVNPLYFYEQGSTQAQRTRKVSENQNIDIIAISATDNHETTLQSMSKVISEIKNYIQNTREQQTEW